MSERTTGTTIEFEAVPEIVGTLQALGITVLANGPAGYAQISMCLETDSQILDVIERLADIRLAYIDHQQRHVEQLLLPLPQEEFA